MGTDAGTDTFDSSRRTAEPTPDDSSVKVSLKIQSLVSILFQAAMAALCCSYLVWGLLTLTRPGQPETPGEIPPEALWILVSVVIVVGSFRTYYNAREYLRRLVLEPEGFRHRDFWRGGCVRWDQVRVVRSGEPAPILQRLQGKTVTVTVCHTGGRLTFNCPSAGAAVFISRLRDLCTNAFFADESNSTHIAPANGAPTTQEDLKTALTELATRNTRVGVCYLVLALLFGAFILALYTNAASHDSTYERISYGIVAFIFVILAGYAIVLRFREAAKLKRLADPSIWTPREQQA